MLDDHEQGPDMKKICLLLILIILTSSCHKFETIKEVKTSNLSEIRATSDIITHEQWIEKVLQKLRLGKGLSRKDPLQEWKLMSEDEFLDSILNENSFEDTLLDMTLNFYGQRQENIRQSQNRNDGYSSEVFIVPQAIYAVKSFKDNGSYFETLTKLHSPIWVKPLDRKLWEKDIVPGISTEESRLKVVEKFNTYLDNFQLLGNDPNTQMKTICDSIFEGDNYIDYLYRIGFSSFLNEYFTEDFWLGRLYHVCADGTLNNFDKATEVNRLVSFTKKLISYVPKWNPEVYHVSHIKDLQTFPSDLVDPSLKISGIRVRTDIDYIPNSSTNMNRKRAAYILKHFFCDDLTPINVTSPASHSNDRHGSDPSCYACHFKLDPMAGFFKNKGRYFRDFSDQPLIMFSDNVQVDRNEYIQQWKNTSQTSNRTWNIGYIRSSTRSSLNSYGENFEDLEGILSSAPEVKACLVRRTFEYFLGVDQARSPAYLEYLSKEFQNELKDNNSADAFKNLIKKILKGNNFKTRNRDPKLCYDKSPGESSAPGIPCDISSLIQKRCLNCHSASGPASGLDLSSMRDIGGGVISFKHHNLNTGLQYSKAETFNKIINRLNTTDVSQRMPLGMDIPDTERSQLYLWVHKEMNK